MIPAADKETVFYYCYDAMCGWCYGFSKVIRELAGQYKQYHFEVISGGMIRGNRIGPASEMASYISQAYKNVEQASGVTFGEPYLKGLLWSKEALYTSVPASKALTVLKKHLPEKQVEIASAFQSAIYSEGHWPEKLATFTEVAQRFGIEAGIFESEFAKPETLKQTEDEFSFCSSLGVKGFPTLIMRHKGQYYSLAYGFSPIDKILPRIEKVLGGN